MEIIPLIVLEKQGLLQQDSEILEKLKNQNTKEKKLYILDVYGIKKNKPHLTLYQKLSKNFDIWVDNGPRDTGDVVDVFMTGATSITLRTETWPLLEPDVENIREISENKIFQLIKPSETNYTMKNIISNVDGYVIFTEEKTEINDFKTDYYFKQFIAKNKTYIYENNIKRLKQWIERKITGILVDLKNYQELEIHER